MKTLTTLLALASVVALGSAAGVPWPPENHYKAYHLTPPYTYSATILLNDQFGSYTASTLVLDKFATPVMKNGEPILDPEGHQTWWRLDIPTEGWEVGVDNQFGYHSWHVGDVRYLVLPARTFEPGPPLRRNHYLAYAASGPPAHVPVQLTDQFGTVEVIAAEPELFLNPVDKIVEDMIYPIIDPAAHLACYRLAPTMLYTIPVVAFDQFGTWQFDLEDHRWLCVPSFKREVVATEATTWGRVKALYHR